MSRRRAGRTAEDRARWLTAITRAENGLVILIDFNEVQPIGAGSAPSSRSPVASVSGRGRGACLGEPNRASTRRAAAFRTHGSLAIEIAGDKRGEWYDHENKIGGGVLDLVAGTPVSNGEAPSGSVGSMAIEAKRRPCQAADRRHV
jgi:hypothetical protein